MALKDFNWQCAAGLHPWAKWEKPKDAPATQKPEKQRRECPQCGKIQERAIG